MQWLRITAAAPDLIRVLIIFIKDLKKLNFLSVLNFFSYFEKKTEVTLLTQWLEIFVLVKVAGPVAVRGLEGLELGPREGSKLGHHLPVEAGRQVGHAHSRLSQAAQRRLIRLLLGAGTSRHL